MKRTEFKNHKWSKGNEDFGFRGKCERCGIHRYTDGMGGYDYLDLRTPIGSQRKTYYRPPCNTEKTIQEMEGVRVHF